MSLDVEGFDSIIKGISLSLTITDEHPLVKLANRLPWQTLLERVLPDLEHTQKRLWWRGRPSRIRIHLGIYLL